MQMFCAKADWIVCISNYTKETFAVDTVFQRNALQRFILQFKIDLKIQMIGICERLGLERNNYIVYQPTGNIKPQTVVKCIWDVYI